MNPDTTNPLCSVPSSPFNSLRPDRIRCIRMLEVAERLKAVPIPAAIRTDTAMNMKPAGRRLAALLARLVR
jgi:hypothetical protein